MTKLGDVVRNIVAGGGMAQSDLPPPKIAKPDVRGIEAADEWGDACAKGDCTYPSPYKPAVDRVMCAVPPTCPGYRAVTRIEGGRELTRWTLCARHRAWWKEEQIRIRKRRAEEAARFKALKATDRRRSDLDDE